MKKNRALSLCVLIAIVIGTLMPFSACDDDFIVVIKKEMNPPVIPGRDVEFLPGGMGNIVISNITASSLSLRWEAATIGNEPVTGATYSVYLSNDNNMSTPDMMRVYGNPIKSGIDFYTYVVDQLSIGTTYYLNVLAQIPGYECAYGMVSITTLSIGTVYMFSTEITKGDFGGRRGADELCRSTKQSFYNDLPCSNISAFLEVSAEDSIAAMPLKYSIPREWPIVSHSGVLIDHNFADLLDGSVINSLVDAGVVIPYVNSDVITSNADVSLAELTDWWSGSRADGTYDPSEDNCNGWTNGHKAITGSGILRDNRWLNDSIANCSNKRPVVCMCW